jgi:hypothetical protein
MRPWIAAGTLALFALAGCADVPPSRAYVLLTDKMEETSQLALYREDLESGDAALLDGKVNVAETYYRKEPACERVRADGYPTPAESAALRRWAATRVAYFEQFHSLELKTGAASDHVSPLAERYVAALRDDLDYSTMLIDDLAAGKMTYCEFATRQKAAILASHDRAAPLRNQMIAAMRDNGYGGGTGLSQGLVGGGGLGFVNGSSGPNQIIH